MTSGDWNRINRYLLSFSAIFIWRCFYVPAHFVYVTRVQVYLSTEGAGSEVYFVRHSRCFTVFFLNAPKNLQNRNNRWEFFNVQKRKKKAFDCKSLSPIEDHDLNLKLRSGKFNYVDKKMGRWKYITNLKRIIYW